MAFIADYPGAIVVEAAQYGYGLWKNHPKAWCLHTPEEKPDDYPGTPYYFHNLTDRRASTTYFVSYLGLVFQCVPEGEGAYANAREGIDGLFDWETPNWNLNLETLSVEIEGYAASIHITMPRSSPQWNALVRLMAHRCLALSIPPERTFGHYQVSKYRSDPGQLNIPAVIADVKEEMMALSAAAEAGIEAFFATPYTDMRGRTHESKASYLTLIGDWLDSVHLETLLAHTKNTPGSGGLTADEVVDKLKSRL